MLDHTVILCFTSAVKKLSVTTESFYIPTSDIQRFLFSPTFSAIPVFLCLNYGHLTRYEVVLPRGFGFRLIND